MNTLKNRLYGNGLVLFMLLSASLLSMDLYLSNPANAGKTPPPPAAGSLDTTFDGDGKVITNVSGLTDWGRSVQVQADGKIVVGGSDFINFELVRYQTGGGLDPTFGTGGKVVMDFGGTADELTAMQIQGDGKILSAGGAGDDFGLVRLHSNGTLDLTFGAGGKSITNVSTSKDIINDLAIQTDGRIVVAGTKLNGIYGCGRCGGFFYDYSIALARYYADGSLDTSFGSNGIVLIPDFDPDVTEVIRSIEVQSDGKILVAGTYSENAANITGFLLARFHPDGSLDTSFGSSGRVITVIGLWSEVNAMTIESDGQVVVAGVSSYDFALARYNPNGSLDAGFGTGGTVVTDMGGGEYAQGLVVQSDGKIVAAGRTDILTCNRKGVCTGKDFALARYNVNGTLDTGFGTSGRVTLGLATQVSAMTGAYGIALQSDGKIVAAGTTYTLAQQPQGNYTDYYDFGVVRFLP